MAIPMAKTHHEHANGVSFSCSRYTANLLLTVVLGDVPNFSDKEPVILAGEIQFSS